MVKRGHARKPQSTSRWWRSSCARRWGDDFHAKRVLSLANATLGAMHAAALGVTTIGNALAQVRSLDPKAAVKQVDRLLSNSGVRPWELFSSWVPMAVGARTKVVVAMGLGTDFDDDDHTTICLNLLTKHGRATPLAWMTVEKSALKGNRADSEDLVLQRLHDTLPPAVWKVTVLADRGFGDVDLYGLLSEWKWDFVIRFRGCIYVTSAEGEKRKAEKWLQPQGRAKRLKDVRVTDEEYLLPRSRRREAEGHEGRVVPRHLHEWRIGHRRHQTVRPPFHYRGELP